VSQRAEKLAALHRDILACRACQQAGCIETAQPVVSLAYSPSKLRSAAGRAMLIGQAPGQVEQAAGAPFAGRAGCALFRWFERIGWHEAAFRRHVYITSVTKCFPGKALTGGGDRPPSPAEIRLCRPWLERQLETIEPGLIVLVGRLAIELYLPGRSLDAVVGEVFARDGRQVLPLPHPSGASRWLNAPANQTRLDRALDLLREQLGAPPEDATA